jgi:hypothetical protein
LETKLAGLPPSLRWRALTYLLDNIKQLAATQDFDELSRVDFDKLGRVGLRPTRNGTLHHQFALMALFCYEHKSESKHDGYSSPGLFPVKENKSCFTRT